MKRIALFVLILAMSTPTQSWAHTPVELLDTDTSAAAGPLITDGTVTFTMKATFANSGQRKAFRAAFKSGDNVSIEYLVADKKPDKSWRVSTLPTVAIGENYSVRGEISRATSL